MKRYTKQPFTTIEESIDGEWINYYELEWLLERLSTAIKHVLTEDQLNSIKWLHEKELKQLGMIKEKRNGRTQVAK